VSRFFRALRWRPLVAIGCGAVGFVLAVTFQARPANPESRLPRNYRLAALIERQQRDTRELRREVETLRARVRGLVTAGAGLEQAAAERKATLDAALLQAGLVAVRGPGLRVTLDDSLLEEAPSGDVNDLVVHSQDVQAVVNALWRAGAEAVSINGQRLVSTSAVLCVGNTLLLNGTVHSPPYVASAVGADRSRFEADSLVRQLKQAAQASGVRVSVARESTLDIPAFTGPTGLRFARPPVR
jgi:uncharacterized protein YlxW (UPF0749 family)